MDGYEVHSRLFSSVPGVAELIEAVGGVPTFHDADVVDLTINARKPSALKLNYPGRSGFPLASLEGRHFAVTIRIGEVADIELEDVPIRGILFSLMLSEPPLLADGDFKYRDRRPDELAMTLRTSYGVSGRIICRDLSVSFAIRGRRRVLPPQPPVLLGQ